MTYLGKLGFVTIVCGALGAFGGQAEAQEFYEQDNGLTQSIETRAAVRLKMPFGKYSNKPEDNGLQFSLNFGVDRTANWRSFGAYNSYDNLFELGLNFKGDHYANLAGVPYSNFQDDRLGISGGGATTLWIIGGLALTAGSVALTVFAIDESVDQIQDLTE